MNTDLKKLQKFPLVNGKFAAEEARDLLMALIESKVAFHSIKNLQSFERSGETDTKSEKRIEELENMRKKMLEIVKQAKETEQQLEIDSMINIAFANDSAVE